MSALFASVRWDGQQTDQAALAAATDCVRHRCPDGAWSWSAGGVGLAQADLATLPEDEPGVPATMGRLHIVASCRIDNRAELRGALPPWAQPAGATDAAYILAAYRAWGEGCVERLVGDFAFAIWDEEQARLFAARDHAGGRQLFYYQRGQRLVVASDRTQILQDPTLPAEIDEEAIITYLTPFYQYGSGWDLGHFRNLHVVPAGYSLSYHRGRTALRRFWSWREAGYDRTPAAEWQDAYLHTLDEAVRCRMRARGGRLAFELSGGLDSPAIAALAARAAGELGAELHTISQVFDRFPAVDERERIGMVLAQYPQLRAHLLLADEGFAPAWLDPAWRPRSVRGAYDLTGGVAGEEMHALAVAQGCRVIFSGNLGDALNDGGPWVYYGLLRRGMVGEAIARLSRDLRRGPVARRWALIYGLLLPALPGSLMDAALTALLTNHWGQVAPPAYLRADVRRRVAERQHELVGAPREGHAVRCPVQRSTLRALIPPAVSCSATPDRPLSYCFPYADRRLVELVLAMPPELKWEHGARDGRGYGRLHHRQALAGLLSPQILVGNPNVEFSAVYRHALAPERVRGWLAAAPTLQLVERGYVERDAFLAHMATPEGARTSIHLLALEAWLRSLATGGAMDALRAQRPAPERAAPTHGTQTVAPTVALQ